ncbi:MAG: class I SAM-dependent methyltransferase [Candidatus Levybacteria bacterium]|nr:class I SAM-dependent methyltransferase [Candidatus Levybacteria bacterium]
MNTEAIDTSVGFPQSHTYEGFSGREFYQKINTALLRQAPIVKTAADFGSGLGTIIEQLIALGKLESPFQVFGIDIDPSAVNSARRKFERYGEQVKFVQGTIEENVPIPDSHVKLVTCFNCIHLTNVPRVLKEAKRILVPNGTLMINTAYEKSKANPGNTARYWGLIASFARKAAKELGYSDIPNPVNLFQHSTDDYVAMAKEAGFTDIKTDTVPAEMDREAFETICNYEDFAQGALPGIPANIARSLLVNAVAKMFERAKVPFVTRNWMFLTARS